MTYPKLQDVDPALLTTIGAAAMRGLERYGWLERRAPTKERTMPAPDPQPEPPTKRRHVKKPEAPARTYASQYKGVSVNRGHYYGIWKAYGVPKCGPIRPYTVGGERWAAQDRARALGLDYLEMRDGTRIAYKQWE